MSDNSIDTFATDKEIFDLLVSGKKQITQSVLIGLLRDRGIFFSPATSREQLVEYMSRLPHDYAAIDELIDLRVGAKRGEKTTSIKLNAELSDDEIRSALAYYGEHIGKSELVSIPMKASGVTANVKYSEFDYSKTRLFQKQVREASIEFTVADGTTTVRLPATEKARQIVEAVARRLSEQRQVEVPKEEISISALKSPASRTDFFNRLMSRMPDFRTDTVTSLKVAKWMAEVETEDLDDEDDLLGASAEMLALVRNVALSGRHLTESDEYQRLLSADFYITSLTWESTQTVKPYEKVQFVAAFEDHTEGTGFKYLVRYAKQNEVGDYPSYFKVVPDLRKRELYGLIESTARAVLAELLADVEVK